MPDTSHDDVIVVITKQGDKSTKKQIKKTPLLVKALDYVGNNIINSMSSTYSFWRVFQLLGLAESGMWLLIPVAGFPGIYAAVDLTHYLVNQRNPTKPNARTVSQKIVSFIKSAFDKFNLWQQWSGYSYPLTTTIERGFFGRQLTKPTLLSRLIPSLTSVVHSTFQCVAQWKYKEIKKYPTALRLIAGTVRMPVAASGFIGLILSETAGFLSKTAAAALLLGFVAFNFFLELFRKCSDKYSHGLDLSVKLLFILGTGVFAFALVNDLYAANNNDNVPTTVFIGNMVFQLLFTAILSIRAIQKAMTQPTTKKVSKSQENTIDEKSKLINSGDDSSHDSDSLLLDKSLSSPQIPFQPK